MVRSIHVLPHTHWDREWYDPFPTFRGRLVQMLDELLPRLIGDPSFSHFQLDGQMAVVDDYLAVRPEQRESLQNLSAAGRLSMGPWYVLPDEFLVSGETLIRNLQLGIARAEEFGGAMQVGYLPDMFGHIAAMPQILKLFGFDHAVVWRGVPLSIDQPAFFWESPDGSRVRAEYLSAGYGNGSDMPAEASQLRERIEMFLEVQGGLVGDPCLWMAGMDHEAPPAHLSRVVAEFQAQETLRASTHPEAQGYELQIGSLTEYLESVPSTNLQTHRGELRSGARANLLMGVASNRVDVKIAAARAERTLERLAEPLCTLWSAEPIRDQPLLDLAWLEVIRNAAHDSICACSHDEVVDAVLHRYAEATETAQGVASSAIEHASTQIQQAGL
ncbi:MAG: alpha-mannosidase, partial [Actinobacteria bacterium]|nr:alpha-mannosidase [Actinomycetota bacterium]